jgi:hypothetical protein
MIDRVLRKQVLKKCRADFLKAFGKPWRYKWARLLGPSSQTDRAARIVAAKLRDVLREVETFAQTSKLASVAALRRWAQAAGPLPPQRPDRTRTELVRVLDMRNLFGLPARQDGSPRFLKPRELAIVSLLAGNWPSPPREHPKSRQPTKPVDVIDAEHRAIAQTLRRQGRKAPMEGYKLTRGR